MEDEEKWSIQEKVQSLAVFVFVFVSVFFQNISDGGVGDEEGRSVFEMFNHC